MATILSKTNQGDSIAASLINKLFTKLDEIRSKHGISQTFSTTVATQGNPITTNYPETLKTDLQILSDNSYYNERPGNTRKQRITNYYPNAITIPDVGTLILASTHYNDYVDLINELDGVCVFCNDHANYNEGCGVDWPNNGNYCVACTYDYT